MLEILKLNTSCVFSSFDKTRCKIYDILCNVVFHGSTSMNKSTNISIEIGIFFFFFSYLNQKFRCVYTKEESKEIDFIPSKRFLVEKKKKLLLYIYIIYIMHYIPRKLSSRNQEFSGLDEFFSRDNLQIFSYITNFVWKDAIRGNDA